MTYGENSLQFSFKMLFVMLIVWVVTLLTLCVGGMLTLALYLGSGLAGSKSNAVVWIGIGFTLVAWALLLHKGVQWILRLAPEKRTIYPVGIYMGFILSQLAASYWFFISWMGG
jgi:hypothetical protein